MEGKGFEGHESAAGLVEDDILNSRPLFDAFDIEAEGGLGVTIEGQIFEVRHPSWANSGQADVAGRTTILPLRVGKSGEISWDNGNGYDPETPSLGNEYEIGVMDKHANWHKLTKDGTEVALPDGRREPFPKEWLDPEAHNYMAEWKTAISYGAPDLRVNLIIAANAIEHWLEERELASPNNTVHPEAIQPNDVLDHEYVQNTGSREGMNMAEFGVLSGQLHVQMKNPAAAMHAMNKYQGVQALTSLLTAGGPVRDNRFDQTVGDHYADTADDYDNDLKPPAFDSRPELADAGVEPSDQPYDWRELARFMGSKSAGVITEPAPIYLREYLRKADESLRDGSNISSVRTLGWHTDRLRLDKGTIEVCNIGTGGNLHTLPAVQELTAKYLIAEQERFSQLSPAQRQAEKATYEADIANGQYNNFAIAIDGKNATLKGPTDSDNETTERTPLQTLHHMITVANVYGPEPVSVDTIKELEAKLQIDETPYGSADEVFDAAFRPHSALTMTDAIRRAHQAEPARSANSLMHQYALARRRHTYEMEHTHIEPLAVQRIGNLAAANALTQESTEA